MLSFTIDVNLKSNFLFSLASRVMFLLSDAVGAGVVYEYLTKADGF